jgi:hypothetical protein
MIPDADEIRAMGQPNDSGWLEDVRAIIAEKLREGALKLQRGERLVIQPVGADEVAWRRNVVGLAGELRSKGYEANVLPDRTLQVMLPRQGVME